MLKPENVNLLHYGALTYSTMTKKINFSVNFSQWTSQERGHCHPQCWRENTSSQMGDHWQVSKKPSPEDKICHIRRWDDKKTDRIVLRIRWQGGTNYWGMLITMKVWNLRHNYVQLLQPRYWVYVTRTPYNEGNSTLIGLPGYLRTSWASTARGSFTSLSACVPGTSSVKETR